MKRYQFSDLSPDIQQFMHAKVMGANNGSYKLYQYGIPLSADLRIILMEAVSWAHGNWTEIVLKLDKEILDEELFRMLPEYQEYYSKKVYKDLFVHINAMREFLNANS